VRPSLRSVEPVSSSLTRIDIRRAIETALEKGQDKNFMRRKPGEVMGYLAYAHPFLDGNGRTIMVVHSVLAQRAGMSIDWGTTNKDEYLAALTQEIDNPGKGHSRQIPGALHQDGDH
jgi:cell filamentation protein, protein adenylyltransferase